MNFLIFGTGADINNIDFSRLRKDFIIVGVNRIFEKIIPDYYYVYDLKTLISYIPNTIKTIYTHPAKLKECFDNNLNYNFNYVTYYDKDYMPSYVYEGGHFDCGHGSVNYLLRMLNNYLFEGQKNTYYLAGVPLLEGMGHFYQDVEATTSVQIALDRFFNDFLRLKRLGYNIKSVMENSRLNEIFPVEDINIIYGGQDAIS